MDETQIDETVNEKIIKESIRDSIVAGIGIVFSVIVYFIIIPKTIVARVTMGHKMPGGAVVSNAEIMPRIWTIVIFIASILTFFESFIRLRQNTEDRRARLEYYGRYFSSVKEAFIENISAVLHIAGLVVLMIIYSYLMGRVGFIISTAMCLAVSLWLFGYRKIILVIVIDAVYVVVIYFVLTRLLYVIL